MTNENANAQQHKDAPLWDAFNKVFPPDAMTKDFHDQVVKAMRIAVEQERSRCHEIACAIDSGRGNEAQIADSIKEGFRVPPSVTDAQKVQPKKERYCCALLAVSRFGGAPIHDRDCREAYLDEPLTIRKLKEAFAPSALDPLGKRLPYWVDGLVDFFKKARK